MIPRSSVNPRKYTKSQLLVCGAAIKTNLRDSGTTPWACHPPRLYIPTNTRLTSRDNQLG
jgi:hypothetical protein